MSEVEAGLRRGGTGLEGLVEGEAGVDHRGHRGQAPLASGGGPRPACLEPPHGRPSRAAGFTAPPFVPGTSAAAREMGRVALGRMEAGIRSDAPLTLSRYDQGEAVVIRGMSGLTRPRPDPAVRLDAPPPFPPATPAPVRLPFLAQLGRAPPCADRRDECTALRVDDREQRGPGKEALAPALVRPPQAVSAGPMGQLPEEGLGGPAPPARNGANRPAREGKQHAARPALTRPACRLGRRGDRPPLGGSRTQYGKNKFFGRHGRLLPSSVWDLEG